MADELTLFVGCLNNNEQSPQCGETQGDSVGIQTDALDSANILRIPSAEIEAIEDSFVSPMPPGLISSLTRVDILDLLAYLNSVSGG